MFEFAAEPNRMAFAKDKAAKLEKVVAFVRDKSESVSREASRAEAASDEIASPVAMLEKLAELKAKGILTDEEFSAQKDKLLKRM
jgi:ParB-like chromosome segregation protein Spo0J